MVMHVPSSLWVSDLEVGGTSGLLDLLSNHAFLWRLRPTSGLEASMPDGQSLPSWNDSAAKSAILDFVARVTKQGATEFVPPAGRIATFDNDGTLWCEQPLQTQFFFAFDRVRQLSAEDPTMRERQPFKAVLEHD